MASASVSYIYYVTNYGARPNSVECDTTDTLTNTELPTLYAEGYKFLGWYLSDDYNPSTKLEVGRSLHYDYGRSMDGDIVTFYAYWVENEIYLIQEDTLIDIAGAIRSLCGSTTPLTFSEMKEIINATIAREDGMFNETIDTIKNDRLTSIKKYGFYQNSALKNASFSSVKTVGDYCFYKCPKLMAVIIPLIETIGTFCFKGCVTLTSANYPLATTVGLGAFDECASLSSVNLTAVTSVEPLTFRKCEALTTVDLPVATSIGTQAFYNSGIASLTLRSNAVCILENEDAFYFTPIEDGTGYIYVPSNLVDSYKNSDGWSTYANQIRAIA